MYQIKTYTFRIKRFNPERAPLSWWEEFDVEMEQTERLLDGLIKIKDTLDGTLTFRRSCAHGICGSCAVKINGKNRLACQTLVKDMSETVTVEPLGEYPLIKDLVVDMGPFFEKNERVMPYLVNNEQPPERERLQSPEDHHRIQQAITCIMCGSCTSSCPQYRANKEYFGPSALLKAYRFLFDSRDTAVKERLETVIHNNGLWRCRSIYDCVEVCPKEIDITGHISELKRFAVKKKMLK
jgi:succinate dehydrogenase / fumarate reductase iron-sulfur subunit